MTATKPIAINDCNGRRWNRGCHFEYFIINIYIMGGETKTI